jgi:hypothetical protein
MFLTGKIFGFTGAVIVVAVPVFLRADIPAKAPAFQEVYEIVRTNIPGLSQEELNRAAVSGLVSRLGGRVSLSRDGQGDNQSPDKLIVSTNIFEGEILLLRMREVAQGSEEAIRSLYDKFSATNKIKGVVLDLRYASGQDYDAAADVSSLFLRKAVPLFNSGDGMISSKPKPNPITVPVAVLVNKETSGSAEALAAALRHTGAGLILGSQTAGKAMMGKMFKLSNGQQLKIAVAPVELAGGGELNAAGIRPDISVEVSPDEEKVYYQDPFKTFPRAGLTASSIGTNNVSAASSTNRTSRRPRFNEAELVREKREGVTIDGEVPANREPELEKPTIHDPTLARALDLLKGLAVVRRS